MLAFTTLAHTLACARVGRQGGRNNRRNARSSPV